MNELAANLLDRHVRGQTTREEQRTLVQQATHDQELFDLLATIGLTEAAVRDPQARAAFLSQRARLDATPSRRPFFTWVTVGASFCVVAALAWFLIAPGLGVTPSSVSPTVSPSARPASVAVMAVRHPVLLSNALELAVSTEPKPEFRAGGDARRLARPTGIVRSVDSGVATIDLGTLDGLDKGTVVIVEADPTANLAEARARVTTVFRDEARIEAGGDVRPGRHVRVPATPYLEALSALIAAGSAAGDAQVVRAASAKASMIARAPEASVRTRRIVLMQLAALSGSRGDVTAAEQYVREAVQLADARPPATSLERAGMLNALGKIVAAGGSLGLAEETLRQAQSVAPPASAVAAEVLNNLGAIAALRDDRATARTLYQSALALMPARTDRSRRSIVEANLSLVESTR